MRRKNMYMPCYFAQDDLNYALSGLEDLPGPPPNPSNVVGPDGPMPSVTGPRRSIIGSLPGPPPDYSNIMAPITPVPSVVSPHGSVAGRAVGESFGPWRSYSDIPNDFAYIGEVAQAEASNFGMLFAGIVLGGVVGFITATSLAALRRKRTSRNGRY